MMSVRLLGGAGAGVSQSRRERIKEGTSELSSDIDP